MPFEPCLSTVTALGTSLVGKPRHRLGFSSPPNWLRCSSFAPAAGLVAGLAGTTVGPGCAPTAGLGAGVGLGLGVALVGGGAVAELEFAVLEEFVFEGSGLAQAT